MIQFLFSLYLCFFFHCRMMLYFCCLGRLFEITGIRKERHRIIDITGEKGTARTVVESRINCNSLLEKVRCASLSLLIVP